MGTISKDKRRVGVVISDDLAAQITERAASINLTTSRYAAMILETWQAQGSPPITEPDRLMQVAKQSAPAGKKLMHA